MLIKELVRMDELGEFRYDVQLSDYEKPKLNLDLLRNYIFTIDAPVTYGTSQRNYSAKDVLDLLIRAFKTQVGDYRMVLTANYGHGKSHLALTLANFFAQPPESEAVQIVMQRLQHALLQPSELQIYRDFKQTKGEFLVVRLQGDRIDDLQEGFLKALQQALREHLSTKDIELPFWHVSAEKWLRELGEHQQKEATTYLAQHGTDLPTLIRELGKSGSYELVRETFKHLIGTYPDFGREINLKDLVVWAVKEVCIPKKLGGLLVLFDEFSLFLQKYVMARSVGKLQELLNGIGDCVGKSAFLAFSQQDVDTVAENYAQGLRLQDVRKELERLPKDKRGRLFSLMESVLASYLKQDEQNWEKWYQETKVKPALVRGREIAYDYFGKHYSADLKWNSEAYNQKVLKGCFPLHPLTTAILAVHNFEAGTSENPRTALQFIRHTWEILSNQPAQLPNGQPNLIYPVALVDFFGEQLSKKWHPAYQNALEASQQFGEVSENQLKVLQALFLQTATLPSRPEKREDQLELLSHLSGLQKEDIRDLLEDFCTKKIIRCDNKVYSLWPASTRPQEVEEVLQQAIAKVPIDTNLLGEIASKLLSIELIGEAAHFGAQSDWQPQQVILNAKLFTADELRSRLHPFRADVNDIKDAPRGLVIWLVAESEEEKLLLRQTAQSILDQAIGSTAHPLPLVIVLPRIVVPNLLTAYRRFKALSQMNTTEREKIGSVFYGQEIANAESEFKRALDDLTKGKNVYAHINRNINELVCPAPYRASVQALASLTLQSAISECYRQAYPYRVSFYEQYATSKGRRSTSLIKAVQNVALGLFSDQIGGSLSSLKKQDIQYQLIVDYLGEHWGLLTKQTYTIQPPSSGKLRQAWDVLEQGFPPGGNEKSVSDLIIKLLNPPYGHDYYTLILLFIAWISYHRHEIRLSMKGSLISFEQLRATFEESKGIPEFFNRVCVGSPLFISRLSPDELFGEIKEIIEQIKQNRSFSLEEAKEALTSLEQAQSNPKLTPALASEIQSYKPRLAEAINLAQNYDDKAQSWQEEFRKADIARQIRMRSDVNRWVYPELVRPNQPSASELRRVWEKRLEEELRRICDSYANLSDLTDYKDYYLKLDSIRKELQPYPHFIEQIQQAIERLKQRKHKLEQKEKEKPILVEINSMDARAGLAVLYQYQKRLNEFNDLSPAAEQIRQSKLAEIEGRIAQFEQLADALPAAVENAQNKRDIEEQKALILTNLIPIQDTSLHKRLSDLLENICYLEDYFDRLSQLASFRKQTPADLEKMLQELEEIEARFKENLSPRQLGLLTEKRQEVESIRKERMQAAEKWLRDIALRYKQQESPDELLLQIENPPISISFLSQEAQANLEKVKLGLKRKIEESTHLRIKTLFRQLSAEARRQVLQELMAIMKQEEETQ